ncbi:MAG: hypothetical protein M5R40_24220 [Anaerolineae bacterium]|nr:hypothetical protein [Anaerolineae bacterium]
MWLRLNFVRIGDHWLDRYDKIVDQFLAHDMRIYGTVGHEVVHAEDMNIFRDFNPPPANMTDQQRRWIENYVDTFDEIVHRFEGRIHVFESFNEPDDWQIGSVAGFEDLSEHEKARYKRPIVQPKWFAEMLHRIYQRVHSSVDVTLVSGPVTGNWGNSNSGGWVSGRGHPVWS